MGVTVARVEVARSLVIARRSSRTPSALGACAAAATLEKPAGS